MPKSRQKLSRVGNPFTCDDSELINIATKAVFAEDVAADVDRVETLGAELYSSFRKDRIESGSLNLWAPIKRNKLKLCSTSRKKLKIETNGSVSELNADRSLFARLLILTRSQRQVDLADILGKYELSTVPRSMFAYDGTMHLRSSKSSLLTILKTLGESTGSDAQLIAQVIDLPLTSHCVAVVDGMAELQAMDKHAEIKTCADLGKVFTMKMMNKYQHYDEVHIVFDTYRAESIKNLTRSKRSIGEIAAEYKITDSTDLRTVSMKKLLSHIRTKDALTAYLAHQLVSHAKKTCKSYVVAWRTEAAASHRSVDSLSSTQEEADTKLILHALDAAKRGATKLSIFAQDTDVLVLAVRRYPELPSESFFMPGNRDPVSLRHIYTALGALKAAALPGFHAFSGCDSTGSLFKKGKLTYWKIFNSSDDKTLHAFASLGTFDAVSDDVASVLESFVCRIYHKETQFTTLAALRWWMFSTKQAVGEKLPPTQGAFLPALRRVNFQAMVWAKDN